VAKRGKNINKGVVLYNKLLKQFTKINNDLPEERKLSVQERRKYISEKIYPQFKGIAPSKVGVKAISTEIFKVLDTIVPKEGCDPNLISPSVYADVMWFELDDYIRDVLPKCIYVRVDADNLGKTKIFNTANYNYETSGLRNLLDKVRDEVKNSSSASFTGVKRLRRGKPNDGTPENYFIDFVLVINSNPTKPINPVIYKVPKEKKKDVTSVRNAILARVKDLTNKRKRRKNARKNAKKNLTDIKKINKRIIKAKSPDYKRKLNLDKINKFLKALKQLDTAFNRGNMNEEQYNRFKEQLNKAIEDAKREGGII